MAMLSLKSVMCWKPRHAQLEGHSRGTWFSVLCSAANLAASLQIGPRFSAAEHFPCRTGFIRTGCQTGMTDATSYDK